MKHTTHDLPMPAMALGSLSSSPTARCVKRLPVAALFSVTVALLAPTAAHADRCTKDAQGVLTCTHNQRTNWAPGATVFGCNGFPQNRVVRWQVPEGVPPPGGWPVAFFYNGTNIAGSPLSDVFASTTAGFGYDFLRQTLHELLDDPGKTGVKYAVIAPESPTLLGGIQYWDTNGSGNYAQKDDACFLPDLFAEVTSGSYGNSAQFNMNRRYAFGFSSGGYNTSRMAVTFNANSTWRALAIVSASYATCLGPRCTIPSSLPANHPPTKFYQGTEDQIVPIGTVRPYFNLLAASGRPVEKVEHPGAHGFPAAVAGPTGIKAWFDRY